VLDDAHVLVRSRLSALSHRQDDDGSGKLFRQLVDVLSVYATFEINEETGEARTDSEMTAIHYDEITSLQVYKHNKNNNNNDNDNNNNNSNNNNNNVFIPSNLRNDSTF